MIQPLSFHQFCEEAIPGNQFIISTVFDDFTPVQDEDPAAVADRGQTVCDHQSGAVHGIQCLRYLFLRFVVQRACCFVEYQQFRFHCDRPGNHDPLFLTTGNTSASFCDHCGHSHRHLADIIGYACLFSSFPGFRQRQSRSGDCYIGIDISLLCG